MLEDTLEIHDLDRTKVDGNTKVLLLWHWMQRMIHHTNNPTVGWRLNVKEDIKSK